jgi:hypothetical protein
MKRTIVITALLVVALCGALTEALRGHRPLLLRPAI